VLSLIYLVLISVFLYFLATWVCDGYFPVGWDTRGWLIHTAMWIPAALLFAGSLMLAANFRKRVSIVFVSIAIAYLACLILWMIVGDSMEAGHYVRRELPVLMAPLLAAAAARILYKSAAPPPLASKVE
jgi:hypothetical protein